MTEIDRITSVHFRSYKAFNDFTLSLEKFNVLVGPNNCGKSTIVGAFRILFEALRKAKTRKAETVQGPKGESYGYKVNLNNLPVASENIFFDYQDEQPASIQFDISNGNQLILFFPEIGECNLVPFAPGRLILNPSQFNQAFKLNIGFVPTLGPVEHNELLYKEEAARAALLTHRASRNFRNIWFHFNDSFD